MSTKTPWFCKNMAEKNEFKVAYSTLKKLQIQVTHCRCPTTACNTIICRVSVMCFVFTFYKKLIPMPWWRPALNQLFIKRKHLRDTIFYMVLRRNAVFFRGGRQLWPCFSLPIFDKIKMFLCPLDWKFPELFKTYPTFIPSSKMKPPGAVKR